MKDKDVIFQKLSENSEQLENYGVNEIGLFGSFIRGEQSRESDLDFLVEFKPEEKTFRNFMGLKRLLEDIFDKDVDLVTKASLENTFRENVLGEVEYAEKA